MKRLWVPLLVAVLALMLVAGSTLIGASASAPVQPSGEDVGARSISGDFVIALPGTAWVPELRGKFALWKPVGWGTEAGVKLAGVGDQWVHMPVPLTYFMDGSFWQPAYITICARSTAPAQTRPTWVDVWSMNHFTLKTTRIGSTALSWPTGSGEQCASVNIPIPNDAATLNISLLLHFANTTDRITLSGVIVSVRRHPE
jgi:hypothetical protein